MCSCFSVGQDIDRRHEEVHKVSPMHHQHWGRPSLVIMKKQTRWVSAQWLFLVLYVFCSVSFVSGPAHILCLTVASGWNKEWCMLKNWNLCYIKFKGPHFDWSTSYFRPTCIILYFSILLQYFITWYIVCTQSQPSVLPIVQFVIQAVLFCDLYILAEYCHTVYERKYIYSIWGCLYMAQYLMLHLLCL
jgi:hypothetical protein